MRVVTVAGRSHVEIQQAVDSLASGGVVFLPPGDYRLERTVLLASNIAIVGAGPGATKIVLAAGSGGHMFTNANYAGGNENIELREFSIDGDMAHQPGPGEDSASSFACGALFRRTRGIRIAAIEAVRIRQSALHFTHCQNVRVSNLDAREMGWSGVSTSCTNDIVLRGVAITAAGLDVRHSGIHLDGGAGCYIDARVDGCTGNAIMLDSKFAPLSDAVVKAVGRGSNNGLALIGGAEHELTNVFVTGEYAGNEHCGIRVSNAAKVIILGAVVESNGEYGIALQGRVGLRNTVIADCRIVGNPIAVADVGGRQDHYEFGNYFTTNGTAQVGRVPDPNVPRRTTRRTPRLAIAGGRRLASMRRRLGRSGAAETADSPRSPAVRAAETGSVTPRASFDGVCRVCGNAGVFELVEDSLREGFRCRTCGANLRYQGQADVLVRCDASRNASSLAELVQESQFRMLHVYEPGVLGALRPYLRQLPNYVTSDFWPEVPAGELRDGVRCEDLMALTFPADAFDLVVTSDVFEHVRHPYVAFTEVHRVLRSGGAHVFSIPVQAPMRKETVPRVDTSGEVDVFILEPRYHLGPGNSRHIVYNDFGEDLLERLAEIGFDTEVVRLDVPNAEAAKLLTFCSVKRSA